MASEHSFDIVSNVDMQEVSNAIQQALKEINQRYDLKDSDSEIDLMPADKILILKSGDDYKCQAVLDILKNKLIGRGISVKSLEEGEVKYLTLKDIFGTGDLLYNEFVYAVGLRDDLKLNCLS